MDNAKKARAVGLNHVALEVGDIDEALAFYRRLFDFELRGKSATSAFIDLGDQFLALQKDRTQPADDGAISDWWSMTRMRSVKRWLKQESNPCPVLFLTSSTHGATGSRLSVIETSNSPKHPTCCGAWD